MKGDFNVDEPTLEQLTKLKQIIAEVRTEFGDLKVYEHGELKGESTSCAGRNFYTSLLLPGVVIEGKSEKASELASYAYELCNSYTGDLTYGCEEMVKTFNGENRNWTYNTVSAMNTNGTRDHGICQLNDRYHLPFIQSKDFKDPYKQIDYCFEVRLDANKKNKMPWRAYFTKHLTSENVVFRR